VGARVAHRTRIRHGDQNTRSESIGSGRRSGQGWTQSALTMSRLSKSDKVKVWRLTMFLALTCPITHASVGSTTKISETW
jgi:hypothetical protein